MMKNKRNPLFMICLIILIVAVITGVIYIAVQYQRRHAYENLAEEVRRPQQETAADSAEAFTKESAEGPAEMPVEIPVDFAALQEQNPDIYAWIHIEDSLIDYPILQNMEDDDYYLRRSITGEYLNSGSIYSQYSFNHGCFEDNVTVLYGHNVYDDHTMFGQLPDYLDEEFRDSHLEIQIYTPEHILTYQVVFAVTFDNRHLLYAFGCTDEMGYTQLIDAIRTERLLPSWIAEPFEWTADERMVILSTCNGNPSQRFLVGAVLINEE